MSVKTRLLIISDTHGEAFDVKPAHKADVVIHCGDLTDESKLTEYRKTLQFLEGLDAPLKLVIAGNHDFTLNLPAFKQRVEEAVPAIEPDLIKKEYGGYGEARRLFDEATGITFLDEGTHHFILANGARMTVYASPYTPSKNGNVFQYPPATGHDFAIADGTDVVITHGPPHGIMDYSTESRRAGCPDLFAAVARARPRVHCFGYIHEGWGAKLVAWRDAISGKPSHFADIDNERSVVVEKLVNLTAAKFDTTASMEEKTLRRAEYVDRGCCATSHCAGDDNPLGFRRHTLFVNAAIEGMSDEMPFHPPWLVDVELPLAGPEV
ncbi:Uu.00g140260.m01.CDS01 [Anthostomella pinea]|uniref:Uu.00g140260.m01.CDS01 n=1 Tax=Anthostomella pinea TaxID=933095 RepID=A0AAI8VQ45_9PEZI|nr:Uu.00g140260.m01.CDS01 [Anthostomella pinea]